MNTFSNDTGNLSIIFFLQKVLPVAHIGHLSSIGQTFSIADQCGH